MKKRVLIIDDEELILLGWKFMLESAGYHVQTATNGTDAIDKAGREKPDIVITDLFIPGMNGIEICECIKKMHPESKVVMISGDPFELEHIQKDFVKAGGRAGYLKKPLSGREIIEAVEIILNE